MLLVPPIDSSGTNSTLSIRFGELIGQVGKPVGTFGIPWSVTSSKIACPSIKWENVWQLKSQIPGLLARNLITTQPFAGIVTVVRFWMLSNCRFSCSSDQTSQGCDLKIVWLSLQFNPYRQYLEKASGKSPESCPKIVKIAFGKSFRKISWVTSRIFRSSHSELKYLYQVR